MTTRPDKALVGRAAMACLLAAAAMGSSAADYGSSTTNAPVESLADMSVEQLMNESVTSVARRETKFNQSAAAISVITQDDIRRLGITTIPDALRLVPGLDVAQINSHEWAVTSRGFNNEFANKLLVLVDGRSVYDTGFGGVTWSAEDVVMEDIDRIEVIRGPGASLWGANAVNGVINIITKSARETQGGMVSVSGGTIDQPITTVQYGGTLATNLFYRIYGKFENRDGLETAAGKDAPDRTMSGQAGARLDWEPNEKDTLTLQGDFYRNRLVEDQQVALLSPPYLLDYNSVNYDSGGNVLGRWTHDFSDTSSLTLQAYYDRFDNEQTGAAEKANTYDFDAQHRFALGSRNNFTWGLGYRETDDEFRSSAYAAWTPDTADLQLFSSFVQDEIALVPDRLKLTLGTKLEHNDITGFEYEPSGRLAWTPTEKQTVWAAVSRAVRTPSWTDLHGSVNLATMPPMPPVSPVPVLISSFGNPGLDSETLMAYEMGYRVELTRHVSVDMSAFYDDYDDLIAPVGISSGFSPNPVPHGWIGSISENAGSGHTYGAEISARWDVTDYWHLTANYSWMNVSLGFNSPYLQSAPRHQAQLVSALDLPWHLELNGMVSFMDDITAPYGIGQIAIPSYVRVDLGLVWHATRNLELGVWGQNLAQDQHEEFSSYKTSLITEIPRGVVARLTLHF